MRLRLLLTLFAAATLTPVGQAQTTTETPSLSDELNALSAGFARKAPPEMVATFARGVEDVRRLGLVESAKNVGDSAPNGELTTNGGQAIAVESLWADGPVVVSFYRGGWCPYCNLQLKALQRSLSDLEGAGAKVVAIAPELAEKATETAAKNGLEFTVLTDRDNRLAKAFGIVFELPEAIRPIYENRVGLAKYNGNDDSELPLAATYVIDTEGVIRWAFLDADYKKRAEPADIVEAVKAVNQH